MPSTSGSNPGSPSIERYGPHGRTNAVARNKRRAERDAKAEAAPRPKINELPGSTTVDDKPSIGHMLGVPVRGTSAFQRPKPVVPGLNVHAHCPYYHLVPKDPMENIAWREFVLDRAVEDPEFAAAVKQACAEDILFWINTFAFTLDPQKTDCPRIPMITWDEQDQAILAIQAADGNYPLWAEKSRNQSWTWNVLLVYGHDFQFHRDSHHMLASFKGDAVESGSNPNSLFSKLDCIFEMQPEWLKPRMSRTSKPPKWENSELGSTITGEANNENLGRSGRQKGMFLDEAPATPAMAKIMEAISAVCNAPIFAGTHQGPATVFAREILKPGRTVLRLHWTQRPSHRRGLFTFDSAGNPILLDKFKGKVRIDKEIYQFPEAYPFGWVRDRLKTAGMSWESRSLSPWFVNECNKLGFNKVSVASEYDIDPSGSAASFFEPQLCDRIEREFVRPPMHTGELDFDDRTGKPEPFIEKEGGRLRLWQPLFNGRLDDQYDYGLAEDVSAGTGASASTIIIVNLTLGTFVGEWACARTSPEKFALQVHAMRQWLAKPTRVDNRTVRVPAYNIWEANGGPGGTFSAKLLELDPSNVYMRQSATSLRPEATKVPGWWSDQNGVAKTRAFNSLLESLRSNSFIVRSEAIVRELREYQSGPGAIPFHPGSVADDPTDARDAHGDRVVALALGWLIIRQRQADIDAAVNNAERPVPPNSLAAHMKEVEDARRAAEQNLLPCEWERQVEKWAWAHAA